MDDITFLIANSFDILCVVESKLEDFFPNFQITLYGHKKPESFIEISANTNFTEIQCIAMELKMSGKIYLIFSFYILPKQNIVFLNKRTEGLDFYAKFYENICMLGSLNATSSHPDLIDFLGDHKLKHFIHNSSLKGYNY